MNRNVFNELEILTITYKSHEIIEKSLSDLSSKVEILFLK